MEKPELNTPQEIIHKHAADACTRRLEILRDTLKEESLDAFVIRDTSNIAWLTAFEKVFDEEAAHALYVDADKAILHTDSRYAQACRLAALQTPLEIDDETLSHSKFIKEQFERTLANNPKAVLGIEDTITVREHEELLSELGALGNKAPINTKNLILKLRAVKDEGEIEALKAAQKITDFAFEQIVKQIKPGMTEMEVKRLLDDDMLELGAEGFAFPTIVAAGGHGASPHAIPGENRIEWGSCVVIDFGAKIFGYNSDMTRTVFIGEPSSDMKSAYDAIRRANEEVEAKLRPGITGKEAHELAETILRVEGFPDKMGHGLGHGVGIDIHELPNLNLRNEEPLTVGNVVTVEPGIYIPDKFGMRLEDFGIITEDGFEVFTKTGHDMVII